MRAAVLGEPGRQVMDDGKGAVEGIRKYFEGVRDPRVAGRCDHLLIDILTIAILAVICGADDWTDIEAFGQVRESWLRQFLELPNGIPSHDTFRRVFELLERNQFAAGLLQWTQASQEATDADLVATDAGNSGFTIRRLFRKHCGTKRHGATFKAWGARSGTPFETVASRDWSVTSSAV